MLRSTILLLILSFCLKPSIAKTVQDNIDSLTNELKAARADSNKVALLVAISRDYFQVDPLRGVEYGKQALKLARELRYEYGIMTANNAIGRCYAVREDLTEALQHFQATLSMARKLNNREYIGHALLSTGNIYNGKGEHLKAIEYFLQAKIVYEAADLKRLSLVFNSIGNAYNRMRDHDEALNYWQKGIDLEEKKGGAGSMLATLYANAGGACVGLKKYTEALAFLFKALELQNSLGNISSTASTLNNIGKTYFDLATNLTTAVPDSLRDKATSLKKALYYEQQALDVSRKTGNREVMMAAYVNLSNVYRAQNNFREALVYFDKYDALKDTLARENNEKEFARIEAEFKVQRMTDSLKYVATLKDQQVARHRTERNGWILALSLASIISLLLINRQKLKQAQGRKLAEAERLRAEELAKQQLADFTQSIQEKNVLIEKFAAEIEKYQAQPATVDFIAAPDSSLLELQSSVILTDEQWINFQGLFDKVHRGYIHRVKEKYPSLTAAELRFIVLSRLELSNKEMAAMLGVSLEAVRTAKHRLLKKLNLPEGVTLYDTVHAV